MQRRKLTEKPLYSCSRGQRAPLGSHLTSCWLWGRDQSNGGSSLLMPFPHAWFLTLPGSFSHLGTLPASLFTGWCGMGTGPGRGSAASSRADPDSGTGTGGSVGAEAAALGMCLGKEGSLRTLAWGQHGGRGHTHLATSSSAAEGAMVCSSNRGSRQRPAVGPSVPR